MEIAEELKQLSFHTLTIAPGDVVIFQAEFCDVDEEAIDRLEWYIKTRLPDNTLFLLLDINMDISLLKVQNMDKS